MVKVLGTLYSAIANKLRVPAAELAGVALVTYAAAQIYTPAAYAVAGIAVLAKSVEWDLKRGESERPR